MQTFLLLLEKLLTISSNIFMLLRMEPTWKVNMNTEAIEQARKEGGIDARLNHTEKDIDTIKSDIRSIRNGQWTMIAIAATLNSIVVGVVFYLALSMGNIDTRLTLVEYKLEGFSSKLDKLDAKLGQLIEQTKKDK